MATATLPRPKRPMAARKGKTAPTFLDGRQVVPEKAQIVGESGKVYSTLSEGAPEIVTITPLDRAYAPKQEAGTQRALTGDQLLAMGVDPNKLANDPNLVATLASLNAAQTPQQAQQVVNTTPTQVANPVGYGGAGVQQYQAQQQVNAAQQNAINVAQQANTVKAGDIAVNEAAVQRSNAATQTAIQAQQAANQAQNQYLNAQLATIPAQQATITAQRATVAPQQAYLNLLAENNAKTTAEEQAIQAAQKNTSDLAATAAADTYRKSEDYKYGLAGVAVPQEINTPNGADVQGLPPGVRARYQTQADLLTTAAANAQKLRDLSAQGASIDVQKAQLKVTAAQVEEAAAKLGTEDARIAAAKAANAADTAGNQAQLVQAQAQLETALSGLKVQQATLATSNAQLGVNQAQLSLQQSQQPPFPGAVFDNYTGTWMNATDAAKSQYNNGIVKDPITGQPTTYSELLARTDTTTGNVWSEQEQTWYSHDGRNKLVNGVWTDIQTGNTLLPDPKNPGAQVWTSPDGLRLRGNSWWDDSLGANGAYQTSDGNWYDPISGTIFVGNNPATSRGYATNRGIENSLNLQDETSRRMFGKLYNQLTGDQQVQVDTSIGWGQAGGDAISQQIAAALAAKGLAAAP